MFRRILPAEDYWQCPKLVNSCSCANIRDHENEIDEWNTAFLVSSDWVEFMIIYKNDFQSSWWSLGRMGKEVVESRYRPGWFIYALAVYPIPWEAPPEWINSDDRRFCTLTHAAWPFKWLGCHIKWIICSSHHNMCKHVQMPQVSVPPKFINLDKCMTIRVIVGWY